MGFTYEQIKNEDLDKFRSFGLVNPYSRGNVIPGFWSVDKENNIYLVGVAVGRGIEEMQPDVLVLILNDKQICIEGYRTSVLQEVHWDIRKVHITENVMGLKNEIYNKIKEALMVHSVYGDAKVVFTGFPE